MTLPNLVGYAGRIIEDEAIDEENPKYLFPQRRERDGVVHQFDKSRLLYNAHRIQAPVDEIIVVVDFFDVFWLWQHGYKNLVALMGFACSRCQATRLASLVKSPGHVRLVTAENAAAALYAIALHCAVQWVQVLGSSETILGEERLEHMLR